jgi:hypothetical protein
MASLTALPIELKDFIFEHLSTPHLLNLSATCKHLHALALPLAYRNLTLTWTNGPLGAARNPKLLILVRPFNQNPDLELVRHLCLRAKGVHTTLIMASFGRAFLGTSSRITLARLWGGLLNTV